jgi:hypothetical protein
LTRIESSAFSSSSLQSITIPPNVDFIDGSAFIGVGMLCISIEFGNQRFVRDQDFLIDVIDRRLIRDFSQSLIIDISNDIEILGSSCFSFCKSLSLISF